MTPHPRVPGTIYLVTRRTYAGSFRLTPLDKVTHICRFCLLCAAQRHHIELHAFCFMSNHFHLVLTDTRGELSEFMHWLDLMLCRCLNRLHRRRGLLWEPGRLNEVKLCDDAAVLDKILYTICNPVRAELVKTPRHWPGFCSLPRHYTAGAFRARRPRVYFSRRDSEVPATAELRLTVPAVFGDLDPAGFGKLLSEHLKARCEEICAEVFNRGGTFLGREKVLAFSPDYCPPEAFKESEIIPFIACKDRDQRRAELEALELFKVEHARSRAAFRAGEREVSFPAGTNWWRKHVGVRCAPLTPPPQRG